MKRYDKYEHENHCTVVSTFLSVTIYAQVPFVHYEVVPNYQVNSHGLIEPIQGNPFQGNDTAKSRNAKPKIQVNSVNCMIVD